MFAMFVIEPAVAQGRGIYPYASIWTYLLMAVIVVACVGVWRGTRRIAVEYPLWVRRAALWSAALYCERCDIVMIPAGLVQGPLAQGMSCHANNLQATLVDAAHHLDEDAMRQLAGR
ncbi:MAG: hypothetical protein ACRDRS_20490 [Pseudonocardiaceae bacterium]